ncbi:MAG: hypothetical protein GX660_25880 [Clostridiaceae bacterium]|nr:hypothetical protein [Clostridiaceae bacterium]
MFYDEHLTEIKKICSKFVKQYNIFTQQELLQQACLIALETQNITLKNLNYELDYFCKKEKLYKQHTVAEEFITTASDTEFLDFIDYANPATVKQLLKKYNKLCSYAEKGNTAWHSIKIDLDEALKNAKLTNKQKYYVEEYLTKGINRKQLAEEMKINENNVKKHIDVAILKIIRYLAT